MPDPVVRSPRPHRLRPPPPGPFDVERPRLTSAIRLGAERGMVVLSAPVGFGSTLAVAQAIRTMDTVAWVSLDRLDADPMSLIVQLAHAVDQATGSSSDVPSGDPLNAVSSIVDAMERRDLTALVLDGVSARTHTHSLEVLATLCDSMPRTTSLIVTTHDRVGTLPIPTLTGRFGLIDQADLALLPDEATQVIVETCPDLSADVVEELVLTCAGWTAACWEVALNTHHHPEGEPIAWLREHGSERITSAALASTTSDASRLLIDTSFLAELTAPLCDSVLARGDSAQALAEAHTFGSLIAARGDQGDPTQPAGSFWIRHPLLTAGLRRRSFGQDITARHRRAARWYRTAGEVDRTMTHLVGAGDFAAAGEFFSLHEDSLYASGDGPRVAAWYTSLPTEAWGRRGWHLLRASWGRAFTGDVRGADVAASQLRGYLALSPAPHPEEATLQGEAELVSGHLAAMHGDVDAMVRHASQAVDLADSSTPVNSVQLAPIMLMRGLLWRGDHEGARRQLARMAHQSFPSDLIREVGLGAQSAKLWLLEGRVTIALQRARRAEQWLTSQDIDPKDVAQHALPIALATAEIESGRPSGVSEDLDLIIADALTRGYVGDGIDALRWQSRARLALGDLSGALASVERAKALILEEAPTSSIRRPLDLQEAWVRHLAGDNVRAQRLVQSLPRSDERTLLWARLTMDRQGSRALSTLAEVTTSDPRSAAEKQVLLAKAAMRRSTRLAENHLTQAADIAGEHGLGLVFLGSDDDLLELAILLGTRTGYDGLVSLAESGRDRWRAASDGRPDAFVTASPTHRALSPGEIQLLAFLPTRDTNEVIARRLGISVNTVKTRLGRLYRKLGVRGRGEAIAEARLRGLID